MFKASTLFWLKAISEIELDLALVMLYIATYCYILVALLLNLQIWKTFSRAIPY